jgi:peptidoglycan/LPS O-acetylase OafA/YrhL
MPSPVKSRHEHIASLEGWRGVVALLVVNFHLYALFSSQQIAAYGYLGVDFFFILSGFIIARQYEAAIATRSITFTQFAVRRLARLYPLYIFSIALFLYINATMVAPQLAAMGTKAIEYGKGPETGWMVIVQLLMLSNISDMPAPWNSAAWSVSVEWIVNLLFFAIIFIFRKIPTLLLGLAIIYCTIYLMIVSPDTLNLYIATQPLFNPTIARGIVGFSIGMLICRYHHSFPVLTPFKLLVMELVFMFATWQLIMMHGQPFPISIDYVFQLVLFPALIILSLYPNGLMSTLVSSWPFAFLGRISYSLYLLHIPMVYAFQYSPYFDMYERPVKGVVFYLVFISFSALVYYLFEKPARKLVRKLSD